MDTSSTPPAPNARPAFAKLPPVITILSDHASQDRDLLTDKFGDVAHETDRDRLQLETRLRSIFDILRHKNTRCPLATAIYGDWGSGKTSAMRWLETRLKEWNEPEDSIRQGHPKVYPVWFDPWRYQTKEEVWRGIIAEVILALFQAGDLNQENVFPRMAQAARKFGAFLGRGFISALANLKVEAGGKAKVPGVAEGSVKVSASGEMFRDIWEEYNKASHPEKAHLNQFEQTLREWVNDFLYEQPQDKAQPLFSTREQARLAIFIDDLDRCLPAVTLEVLEALKLYLNIPGLIFIVGLDDTVVRAVITDHYKKASVDEKKSRFYLDKIFQVEARIEVSAQRMTGFMRQQIEVLDAATERHWSTMLSETRSASLPPDEPHPLERNLVALAGNNPRTIKRLLNTALLRGQAAYLDDSLTPEAERRPHRKSKAELENLRQRCAVRRFSDGVQVFLVQTWLQNTFGGEHEWIRQDRTLRWLEDVHQALDLLISESKLTVPEMSQRLQAAGRQRMTGRQGDKGPSDLQALARTGLLEGFYKLEAATCDHLLQLERRLAQPPEHPESPIWLAEAFLSLMTWPFVKAIAEHYPPPVRSQDVKFSPAWSLDSLHYDVLSRLASAAGVTHNALTLEHLTGITQLDLSGTTITSNHLATLIRHMSLTHLDLADCRNLTSLDGLSMLSQLRILNLRQCIALQGPDVLMSLAGLDELEGLYLIRCPGLRSTAGLGSLKALKKLDLEGCTGLNGPDALQGLTGLNELEALDLTGCTGLHSTQGLGSLPALKKLDLRGCRGLTGMEALQGLAGLDKLELLDLTGCTGLQSTKGIDSLPELRTLYLRGCTGLEGAEALQGLTGVDKLRLLDLTGCTGVTRAQAEALKRTIEALPEREGRQLDILGS